MLFVLVIVAMLAVAFFNGVGLGLKRDAREVRWKTVGEMSLAWIVTLPAAALIAALACWIFRVVP